MPRHGKWNKRELHAVRHQMGKKKKKKAKEENVNNTNMEQAAKHSLKMTLPSGINEYEYKFRLKSLHFDL